MKASTRRLPRPAIEDGGDDEAGDDDGRAPRGKDEAGACHEPEGEQQHDRADPVSRQDATRGRKPEDDQPVHRGQKRDDQVLSIQRVRPRRKQEGRQVQDGHRQTQGDRAIRGIGVPVGMTTAARSHMTAAAPVVMRNPVRLSAPPWRWYSRSTRSSRNRSEPRRRAPRSTSRLGRRSICRLGRPSRSGRSPRRRPVAQRSWAWLEEKWSPVHAFMDLKPAAKSEAGGMSSLVPGGIEGHRPFRQSSIGGMT